jgi:tubulin monoglycylase TTLL3/8
VAKVVSKFLSERSLPKDSKVFTIIGHYDDMR